MAAHPVYGILHSKACGEFRMELSELQLLHFLGVLILLSAPATKELPNRGGADLGPSLLTQRRADLRDFFVAQPLGAVVRVELLHQCVRLLPVDVAVQGTGETEG